MSDSTEPLLSPDEIDVTFNALKPEIQQTIIAKINTETKKKNITFKDYISELENDTLHCFITRNGESAFNATVVSVASLAFVGIRELRELVNRFFNIRYLNYLYKFDNEKGESFFITFKKRINKGIPDKFSDFGITLSKHVDNPNDCKSVALQYTPDKKIVNGTVDVLGNMNRTKKVSLKNEYKSDVHNHTTVNNMIVLTGESCRLVGDTLNIDDINSAIALIKDIDYKQFLDKATLTLSGAGVSVDAVSSITNGGGRRCRENGFRKWETRNQTKINSDPNRKGGGLPPENTGSTRKNKYMYRITSRKRRLYRKKSRKGKNAYKKLRSRKIARK